jgi:membrane protease YdiL (CAAX protease family)
VSDDIAPSVPVPLIRHNGRDRLVAIAEVLACSSVPTQVLLSYLLPLAGLRALDAAGQLSLGFVFALSLIDTLVLVALMVLLTRMHGDSVYGLWIGPRPIGREVLLGVLLVPPVFFAVALLLNVLRLVAPWLHNVPQNPLEQLAGTPGEAAMFALVAIFAGGLREELQRAFLLRRFEQYLGGPGVGVFVLNVAFGLGHSMQGWDAAITTGALGAFWAVLYLKRRSAVAPIVSHAGFNTAEILRVLLVG